MMPAAGERLLCSVLCAADHAAGGAAAGRDPGPPGRRDCQLPARCGVLPAACRAAVRQGVALRVACCRRRGDTAYHIPHALGARS
jgi:hypothetical protein